jgi:hypothetical protein
LALLRRALTGEEVSKASVLAARIVLNKLVPDVKSVEVSGQDAEPPRLIIDMRNPVERQVIEAPADVLLDARQEAAPGPAEAPAFQGPDVGGVSRAARAALRALPGYK